MFTKKTALATFCLAGMSLQSLAQAPNAPIKLYLDARQASQKMLHGRLILPVKPGDLTLLYPKWIPGEHGPTGPILNLTGLKLTANGKMIPWERDPVEMFAVRCKVPAGAAEIVATYDFLYSGNTDGFSSGASATSQLAVISWNQALLYPGGNKSDDLKYEAHLMLPEGWKYGTALQTTTESAEGIAFKPVSLTTLVDSPVAAGVHFRKIPIGDDDGKKHEIDLIGDSEASLGMPDGMIASYKQLVKETGVLFGARHYGQYKFLFTLSDHVASFGLEHHESSDDRVGEKTFTDESKRKNSASLLPHEFFHSWNGKYRRPAGLATSSYDQPMKGELLWVYEGLTDYYGEVLASRCGLYTPADIRERFASVASDMENAVGRKWRPLADTAVAAQLLYSAPREWQAVRRGTDFYSEGDLLWLEVDTIIRQKTEGKSSLDDFCRAFHGGKNSLPLVKSYVLNDIVTDLNRIAPYDWSGFFKSRVYDVNPHAPLGGIENSGWKLVFNEIPNEYDKSGEDSNKSASFITTLGFSVSENGNVSDLLPGSPAALAGVSPGQKVIAVNGKKYSAEGMKDAVTAAKTPSVNIEVLAEDGDNYRTFKLDYHGGLRYPHLERDTSKPDLLTEIMKAHAKR